MLSGVTAFTIQRLCAQHRIDAQLVTGGRPKRRRWMILRDSLTRRLTRGEHPRGCECKRCVPMGVSVTVKVLLTQDERDILDRVAIRYRVSRSEAVRTMIHGWDMEVSR